MKGFSELVGYLFKHHVVLYYRRLPIDVLSRLIDQIDPPKKIVFDAEVPGIWGTFVYAFPGRGMSFSSITTPDVDDPVVKARLVLRQARPMTKGSLEDYAKARETLQTTIDDLRQRYPLDALALVE